MREKQSDDFAAHVGMASLAASYDWASTPLGPREHWPRHLKAAVETCLTSPVAMATWWGEALLSIHNDAFAASFGLENPDCLGCPAVRLWPAVWPRVAPCVADVLRTGQPQAAKDVPFRIDRGRGPIDTYFTLVFSPLQGTGGRVAGLLVTAVDTTEQVVADGRAGETARMHCLLENAPGLIAILQGPDHVIAFANRAYREMAGDEHLVGKRYRQARQHHEAFAALLDHVYESGERVAARQKPFRGPAGEMRYVDFVYEPIRDAAGAVTGIFGAGHDVTDHVTTKAALQASESRFRAVANLVPDMLWRNDAEGHLLWFNQRWHDYTGLTHAASVGDDWLDAIHPDDRGSALTVYRQALELGESFEHRHRIRRRDSEYRWHLARMEPVHGADGRISAWFGAITDVDELIRLQQHERLLLGELQHRVRNTLAVVRSIVRRTGEQETSIEAYKQHLEGRISAFARTQAQVTRDPAAGVSLSESIADEFLAHGAHEGGQVRLAGPEIRLRPDAAEKLSLAIHELATNAVKFGGLATEAGQVSVSWAIEARDAGAVLVLDWREAVPGGILQPEESGFGTELLTQSLPYELGARTMLDFDAAGLRFSLEVPLARIVTPGSAGS